MKEIYKQIYIITVGSVPCVHKLLTATDAFILPKVKTTRYGFNSFSHNRAEWIFLSGAQRSVGSLTWFIMKLIRNRKRRENILKPYHVWCFIFS